MEGKGGRQATAKGRFSPCLESDGVHNGKRPVANFAIGLVCLLFFFGLLSYVYVTLTYTHVYVKYNIRET